MICKKTLISLLILFALTQAQTLPGLDYLKSGYDGTRILNDQLGQSKYSIFDFSGQDGAQDFYVNGNTYKVPFVVQATSTSVRKENSSEQVMTSYDELIKKYSESISFSVGVSWGNIAVDLSFNHQLEELHRKMTQEGKAMHVSQSYWAMYSITTAPAFLMPLNPMFKQSMDALNMMAKVPTTEAHQTIYNQVISSFGTHYVSSVIMGGNAKVFTSFEKSYVETTDARSVKNDISLNFKYLVAEFKFGRQTADMMEHPTKSFMDNTASEMTFSPEVTHLDQEKPWASWETQVPINPQPVNTTVAYISDLVFQYPEVQLHLRKTIDFYLRNARFPSLAEIQNFHVLQDPATRLIPGAEIVGCGYDATTFADKRCIVELSGETSEWANPNYPEIVFNVPDELFVMNKPESVSLNGTTIFSSFNDFVRETFWETRQDSHGFLGFGAKRKTVQYHEFYEKMYSKYQKLVLNMRQITWYNIQIPTFPKPKFNSVFQQSLNMLPQEYNSNSQAFYRQFIEAFGTHIVVESDFGGMVYAEDWFETCLTKMFDEVWIKEEVRKRYDPFGFFRKNGQSVSNTTHISTEFKQNSEFHALLLGGTDTISLDKWNEWVPTVKYNPKALNRKLVPLTHFLPEGAVKNALNQALFELRQEAANEQTGYISEMQKIAPPPKPICNIQSPRFSRNFLAE